MSAETSDGVNIDWDDLQSKGPCTQRCHRCFAKFLKVLYVFLLAVIAFVSILTQKATVVTVGANMHYHGGGTGQSLTSYNHDPTHYTNSTFHIAHVSKTVKTYYDVRPSPARALPCKPLAMRWTWSLFLILVTPEVCIVMRGAARWRRKRPDAGRQGTDIFSRISMADRARAAYLTVFIVGSLHTIGVAIFSFVVLPLLESVVDSVLLLSGVGLAPALLNLLCAGQARGKPLPARGVVILLLDAVSCLAQGSVIIVWPILIAARWLPLDLQLIWAIPVGLLLSSLGWSFNYLGKMSSESLGCTKYITEVVAYIETHKLRMYTWLGIWRICLIFISMVAFTSITYNFGDIFSLSLNSCSEVSGATKVNENEWLYVWLINVATSAVGQVCCYSAARVCCQCFGYSLPVTLSGPVLMTVAAVLCQQEPSRFISGFLSERLAWQCPDVEVWFWLVFFGILWLSQLWISRHLWVPDNPVLASFDRLFHAPMWHGVFFEEHLRYNRLLRDADVTDNVAVQESHGMEIPFLKVCATMWHETTYEMERLIKSICKMDIDQSNIAGQKKRKNSQAYSFEAHIFFDDAVEKYDPARDSDLDEVLFDRSGKRINAYVTDLMITVEAAGKYYGKDWLLVGPPVKYTTPYGGRLVYVLPGGHNLVVHLKDQTLVRKKKRSSQIMYMRYFLNYELGQISDDTERLRQAQNRFLLALDGDVTFEPGAIRELLGQIKNKPNVAAMCGRIIPVGPGWLVWYQKFEYAIGHWLQKASEHVMGSVLCSPGCFSIYRASLLANKTVLDKFVRRSAKGHQHVRCDLGEDLWLCLLLMKQGYHIQYCETAEADTIAPTSLNELFKQRRRWMSSGFLNLFQFILTCKKTLKVNNHLTYAFMLYQGLLVVLNLTKTALVLLAIIMSVAAAVPPLYGWLWFALHVTLWVGYIIVCYFTRDVIQLRISTVLTAFYWLMQVVVMSMVIRQTIYSSVCSPTFIFFCLGVVFLITAALIHPTRFFTIVHGLSYFFLIPTIHILLNTYTMCNLNNISWGVREKIDVFQEPVAVLPPPDGAPEGQDNLAFEENLVGLPQHEMRKFSKSNRDEVFMLNLARQCSVESDRIRSTWLNDDLYLDDSPCQKLGSTEEAFLKELVGGDLKPEDPLPADRENMERDLRTLRNKVLAVFVVANVVFIIILIVLTEVGVRLPWPCEGSSTVEVSFVIFLAMFGAVVLIQFSGMMIYRFRAIQRLVANTQLFESGVCGRPHSTDSWEVHTGTGTSRQEVEATSGGDYRNLGPLAASANDVTFRRPFSWSDAPPVSMITGRWDEAQTQSFENLPMTDSNQFISHL